MSKANIGQVRDFGASQNPEGKMRNEMSILSNLAFTDECLDKNETK